MVSTFDHIDQVIRDSEFGEGRRVVTFANVLQHKVYPLADSIDFMLQHGQEAMGRPVEIEFAGMIDMSNGRKGHIYWLQIRPIIDRKELVDDTISQQTEFCGRHLEIPK